MTESSSARNAPLEGAWTASAGYVESLFESWKADPNAVDAAWRAWFEQAVRRSGGALASPSCPEAEEGYAQSRVASLIYAYRSVGHLIAVLDPLGDNRDSHPDLELEAFGFDATDLDRTFDTGHLFGASRRATLREILDILRDTYCRTVAVEYLHIQDVQIRRWLQAEMEPVRNRPAVAPEARVEILRCLTGAEAFEQFVHARYPGQKRFSLEGAEALIPALTSAIEAAARSDADEIVLAMTHRGRLNVLANVLHKSHRMLFCEFEDNYIPLSVGGDGDVKYHKGFSSDSLARNGKKLHLSLTANPSHLEAVNPVALGRVRAKQRQRGDTERRDKVIPILVHGDAAFAGQGVVAETLNLSRLKGYHVGGTLHLVVNNQIGFTTSPHDARSTLYCTDVAKTIEAPIFHVNGDDPEAVAYVADLAMRFRQEFHRDVVVDLVCFRRHGHNEGDEPAFTQPVMYAKIKDRPSVRTLYARTLHAEGVLGEENAAHLDAEIRARLDAAFEEARVSCPLPNGQAFEELWRGLQEPFSHHPVETGVSQAALAEATRALVAVPEGFRLHPKIERTLSPRIQAVHEGGGVDWAFAEALAFGTLLAEGVPIRLTGQDSQRGTFSHRHAVWRDTETQELHIPLLNIRHDQARFCVYNSPLNEASCLGFEYGHTLAEPRMLILWEAQFGDFANGAQVIVDQFLVSSESKWHRTSGLVLLLPHGYEGQGPEHSSAYLERYLAACAENNIQVCNLTTPAQYFHVLRRQVKRPFRRPLILMAPKSLLRHPRCVSPLPAFREDRFREVLDDPTPPTTHPPRRLLLCSGKIYYDLAERRETVAADDIALVRIEQLYPFPENALTETLAPYRETPQIVWVQEEPQNRGAWSFMLPRLQVLFPGRRISYIGRGASASPAVASLRIHKLEQQEIVEQAIGGHEPIRSGSQVLSRKPEILMAADGATPTPQPTRNR